MSPTIQAFFHRDSSTYSYLVADPSSRRALLIDPVLDYEPKSGRTSTVSAQALIDAVQTQGLQVEWLLETHAHADHLSAAHWLKQQWPQARIAIGAGIVEVQRIFAEVFNLGADFARDGSQFDQLLVDGAHFQVGALDVEVIATPGHTSDSVSYRIGDALFVGDSIFLPDSGTARCDFPGGDAAILYQSIQRLYALPADTRVFVCHDYAPGGREPRNETTIAALRASNIHVRDGIDEASFVATRRARDATLAMPVLLLPAVQVNIRAGALPPPESNGVRYLKIPLDRL